MLSITNKDGILAAWVIGVNQLLYVSLWFANIQVDSDIPDGKKEHLKEMMVSDLISTKDSGNKVLIMLEA